MTLSKPFTIAAGYILLLATSGRLVRRILAKAAREPLDKTLTREALDTGTIIGKCENLLILTFMLLEAYTALALIFVAKTIVRREDIRRNSLFFLAGTLINVTYSIILGAALRLIIVNL